MGGEVEEERSASLNRDRKMNPGSSNKNATNAGSAMFMAMSLRRFCFRYYNHSERLTILKLNSSDVFARISTRSGGIEALRYHETPQLIPRLRISKQFRGELAFECFHASTMP